jgi:hypothetical protein
LQRGTSQNAVRIVNLFLERAFQEAALTNAQEQPAPHCVNEARAIVSAESVSLTGSPLTIIIWPILNIYEKLSGEKAVQRQHELGIQR